jgi:hypothetical protein
MKAEMIVGHAFVGRLRSWNKLLPSAGAGGLLRPATPDPELSPNRKKSPKGRDGDC